MVVGAPTMAVDNGLGAAYIYIRRAENIQITRAKLNPAGSRLEFGSSVAIKGNVVAVGNPKYGRTPADVFFSLNKHKEKGAVFIYTYDTRSGYELSELPIHNTYCKQWFGYSVELTDDRGLFVGCPLDENNSGSVYFYTQSDDNEGEFILLQTIEPSDGGADADDFGWDIAEDGNIVAIGTHKESRGKVYVFSRINGDWTEVAIIDAPEGDVYFGESLALSGNTLVISSRHNAYSYLLDGCSR